ncbi:MAG: hypothetical protein ACOX24_06405 [Christensenellales bacterium]|jgi:pimeloyl-ACP methyl ester carboxylesterase
MKKTISRTIAAILICAGIAVLISTLLANFVLKKSVSAEEAEFNLKLAALRPDDNTYVDYANDVKFDLSKDPELVEQGLFWITFDENGKIVKTKADTEQARGVVDPNKPTLILIHGMQAGHGQIYREDYYIKHYYLDWNDFGVDTSINTNLPAYFNMSYVWMNQGWNIGYYHCEKFMAVPEYWSLEQKMWTWVESKTDEDGNPNMGYETSYINLEGKEVKSPIKYGISEHFVAEYIRAMNMLPESMGEKEIRIAAHSMGGQVAAPALFLLYELARDEIGQIPKRCLPDRYALMDTFFSAYAKNNNTGEWLNLLSDNTIAPFNIGWTGKPFIGNSTGHTIAFILEYLDKAGMALEYYTEPASFLYGALPNDVLDAIHKHCSVVIIEPDWADAQPGYTRLTDGHNGVREWYMCSLTTTPPTVLDDGSTVPNASMSCEDIRGNHGRFFYQIEGTKDTITTNDVFELRDKHYAQLALEAEANSETE